MGATVQSSLALFDAFSRPLKSITQALNLTISAMEKLQSTTNQNADMSKTFTAAKHQIASAEAEINVAINKSTNAQNNFNSAVGKGRSAFSGIGGAIVVMNQGLELATKLFGGIKDLMTFADDVSSANAKLGMMTDNLRTQRQLQQQVMDVANRTRQSYSATADLMTKLGMGTEGVFKNNDAQLAFTERFNKTLIASGATAQQSNDAILQMSQALGSGVLQGDELRSISEQAPLVMKVIADGLGVARGSLKKMGADGKLTADLVVKAFEKQSNSINTMFNKMPITFGQSMTLMKNKAADWIGKLNSADGPLQNITRAMQNLVAWMDSTKGAQFFNVLSIGLATAATGFSLVTQGAMAFWNFFSTYWPEITAAVLILAMYYLPMMTRSLWQMLVPIYQAVGAWLLVNWPILLIIAAVVALIAVLRYFGVSTEQIVGTVVGYFFMLVNSVRSQVAFLWNFILAFAEFLVNIFIDPVYAVKKLFFDMTKNVIDYFGNMINNIIDGLNFVIDKTNQIAGTTFDLIAKIDTTAIDKYKPTSDKSVVDFSKYRMEQISNVDAFKNGYSKGATVLNKLGNVLGDLKMNNDMGKMPDIGKIGSVGEVGKIKDTVDISNEDLKVMRDLAEMKNIQNFITLTPTVQLTGDIHNNDVTDVDMMIKRIEEAMEGEIANSAQGVYQP